MNASSQLGREWKRERETEKVGMESNREKGRKMTLLEQQCGERESRVI